MFWKEGKLHYTLSTSLWDHQGNYSLTIVLGLCYMNIMGYIGGYIMDTRHLDIDRGACRT